MGQLGSKPAIFGAAVAALVSTKSRHLDDRIAAVGLGYALGLLYRFIVPEYEFDQTYELSPSHGIIGTWLGYPAVLGAWVGLHVDKAVYSGSDKFPKLLFSRIGYLLGVCYRWWTPPIRFTQSSITLPTAKQFNNGCVPAVMHNGYLHAVGNRTLHAKKPSPFQWTLFGSPHIKVVVIAKEDMGPDGWNVKFTLWNGGRWVLVKNFVGSL